VAFLRSTLQLIGAFETRPHWREITPWLSVMARGQTDGCPHPKCIDVMEGEIMEA